MRNSLLAPVLVLVLLSGMAQALAQPYAVPSTIPQAPRQPVTSPFNAERFTGKPVIALCYSIDNPRAGQAVQFLQEMFRIRGEYNFEVLGININSGRPKDVLKFNQQYGAAFPLLIDNNGDWAKKLNLTGDLSLFIFGKKGDLTATVAASSFPPQRDLTLALRLYVNRIMNLGFIPDDEPVLGDRPPVPFFEGSALNGENIAINKACEKGPVILLFFSPVCSHCRDEMVFLNDLLKGREFKDKFSLIAVSRLSQAVTEKFVKEHGFTFPVLIDTGNAISALFPSFGSAVPVAYFIDRSGGIVAHHTGFSERTGQIYLMELRALCGLPNKPLLVSGGYSGQDRCRICHEKEHEQWSLTRHAYAFKSLQRKGKEDDAACVSCHVTGWGQPGGYKNDDKKEERMLENVQCEVCHGPGYLSCSAYTGARQKKKSAAEWKALCLSCHTEQQSLNFTFGRRYPKVLHSTLPDLSSMSRQQRVQLLQSRKGKSDLFDTSAAYVGAQSCKQCHELEYGQWSTTPHALAGQTAAATAAPAEKKYRYNTGAGGPGGYPAAGMQNVQCEACHGPGERHIKEPNKKGQDYIVGLSGQCDSCVVEQICRTCHGPDDDPNFKFEQYREKIRHTPKP